MSFTVPCLPLLLLRLLRSSAHARRWCDGTELHIRQPPAVLCRNKDQRRAIVTQHRVAFVLDRVRLVARHDGGARVGSHPDLILRQRVVPQCARTLSTEPFFLLQHEATLAHAYIRP